MITSEGFPTLFFIEAGEKAGGEGDSSGFASSFWMILSIDLLKPYYFRTSKDLFFIFNCCFLEQIYKSRLLIGKSL